MFNKDITTYASSGVDIEAGDKAVELMKDAVKMTHNSNVFTSAGGFAGMYDIKNYFTSMKNPVLSSSTDGVGTKVAIAQAIDKHDTIGIDLVGMVVDDIVVTGAKPLFMTDYICVGKVIPQTVAKIVGGIAKGCEIAQTALVAGETAEHPGLLGVNEYDLAGSATGIIDRDDILSPDNVKNGDKLVAIASSGLHSNGFSLVRNVFKNAGWSYERVVPELANDYLSQNPTLGEALLVPTQIYTSVCLDICQNSNVKIFSHITGGGIASNLARVLPKGLTAVVNRSSWNVPNIFQLVAEIGNVPLSDLEKTLNLGIGMIAVVSSEYVEQIKEISKSHNLNAWVCGDVFESSSILKDINPQTIVSNTKGVEGGKAVIY